MSDFKYHIGNKFSSCKLIGKGIDPHRGRDVKLFHMPGDFQYVGVFDGTDAFIAPVNIDPYSAGIMRAFDDIRAGKEIVVQELAKPRVRVRQQRELPLGLPEPPQASPKPRDRVLAAPTPQNASRERVRVRA